MVVRERGFALLELLFVLLLLSVGALVALPRATGRDRLALETEALRLASDLRWMQQYSMNLAAGQVNFPELSGDLEPRMRLISGRRNGYAITLSTKIIRERMFERGIVLSNRNTTLYFNGSGYINSPITILLYRDRLEKAVVIDRVGRIRIR